MTDLTPGTIIGPYRIEALLGEGGMAQVFRVFNTSLNRHEALKVIKPEMVYHQDFVARFLREAQTAAQLQHPNIAIIYSISPPDAPPPYFTMELLDGIDLSELLRNRGGRFFEPDAIHLLSQLASGLDYAHSRGIIHRDVKPANVLVTREGIAKLVDFGIAKAADTSGSSRLTQKGMIVGTPEYMSPEQAGSGAPVGAASDQYSLAIIAYELLTGQVPFSTSESGSTMQVLMSHLKTPVPELPQWEVSKSAKRALLRSLSKDSTARFPTCLAFVAAMVAEAPEDIVSLPPSPSKHRPYGLWLIGVSAIIGIGLVGYSLLRPSPPILSPTPPMPSPSQPVNAPTKTESSPTLRVISTAASSQTITPNSSVQTPKPEQGEKIVPKPIFQIVESEDLSNIRRRYYQWINAWENRDIDSYMHFYSPMIIQKRADKPSYTFQSLKIRMKEMWLKQAAISIKSDEPNIHIEGDRVVLEAFQHYDSSTWWDKGTKRMVWLKENGEWRIIQEAFQKNSGGSKK